MATFTNQNNSSSNSQPASTSTVPSSASVKQVYGDYLDTLPDAEDREFQGMPGVLNPQANLASLGTNLQPGAPANPNDAGGLDESGNIVQANGAVTSVGSPVTKPLVQTPSAAGDQVLAGVNLADYATDPNHFNAVSEIYNGASNLNTPQDIDAYIQKRAPNSPVKSSYIMQASQKYGVDPKLVLAIIQQDSMFGTKGLGAKTRNPGNVANNDRGNKFTYPSWQAGVQGVARFLAKNKVSS